MVYRLFFFPSGLRCRLKHKKHRSAKTQKPKNNYLKPKNASVFPARMLMFCSIIAQLLVLIMLNNATFRSILESLRRVMSYRVQ